MMYLPQTPVGLESTAQAAIDSRLAAAEGRAQEQRHRWDAIYRAATCAAAEAIQARKWEAKRQALAVMEQAGARRDIMLVGVFGTPPEVPRAYAAFEAAGAAISRDQVDAALRVIAADKPTSKSAPVPVTGKVLILSQDRNGYGRARAADGRIVAVKPYVFRAGHNVGDYVDAKDL